MKKIITLTLALFIVFSMTSFTAVSAQSSETNAAITASYGTPAVDGDLDEVWNSTAVQDIKLTDTGVIPSETKTTGTVRVLWDEKYLYFFITVDKHGVEINAGGGSENTDDCADVCFTMNGDFNGESNVTGGDAFAGVFRTLEDGSFSGFGDYQTENIDDFKGKMKRTSNTTYNCEYAIPWKNITPNAGYVMGMDIQINDATDGARSGLVNWAYEPCYGWRDSKYHGMVTLLAAPVPATTEEVTAEPETAAPEETAAATVPEPAPAAPQTGDSIAVPAAMILIALTAGIFTVCKKRTSR